MKKAAIINFGGGNLFSVAQACKTAEMEPIITQDPKNLDHADLLFLPGVGAFKNAMMFLQERGLDEAILKNVAKGKLLVGVCLGMQIMTTQSEEFGQTKGLNLIPGQVRYFKGVLEAGAKIPHTGWNSIVEARQGSSMENTVGDDFYFIHSLYAQTDDPAHTIARCTYHNVTFAAAIERDNIIGFQFHPERSGESGLALYKNIIRKAS
ncbi:MAG: imidazole glycerol phosphate synthase subunit HisH [Alphaproteobacteria bacterium]|nr:imidazole glycerol phosphate synthase subunit HisH [Alphaproteobacteria bacterium]